MTLRDFNNLDKKIAAKELFSCCGSQKWVSLVMNKFPFRTQEDLAEQATTVWYDECDREDWLESFTHHPKIGDKNSLTGKFAGTEQAGVASATEAVIGALAKANSKYENKFGFLFIVCATGRSAEEMLQLLNHRIRNDIDDELNIAMNEQHKITFIRFKKLFDDFRFLNMSQVTTHVLDTSAGKPGKSISIQLMQKVGNEWKLIAQGITNADGRAADLCPAGKNLSPGSYKIVFETGDYYAIQNIQTFYPAIEIQFTIFDDSHYHVPLLISPFGYSTYRGS